MSPTPQESACMEMEGRTLQSLERSLGHEIHPISLMMARFPPLNQKAGLASRASSEGCASVEYSPISPSIVSLRSTPIPNNLDEYLSSNFSMSSVSTPSYRPVQMRTSATQTDAPPQVHTQGTQTEIHPFPQSEVSFLKTKSNRISPLSTDIAGNTTGTSAAATASACIHDGATPHDINNTIYELKF